MGTPARLVTRVLVVVACPVGRCRDSARMDASRRVKTVVSLDYPPARPERVAGCPTAPAKRSVHARGSAILGRRNSAQPRAGRLVLRRALGRARGDLVF